MSSDDWWQRQQDEAYQQRQKDYWDDVARQNQAQLEDHMRRSRESSSDSSYSHQKSESEEQKIKKALKKATGDCKRFYSDYHHSKEAVDGWGTSIMRHYDKKNKQIGYSKVETNGWGQPVTRHFDMAHTKVGYTD